MFKSFGTQWVFLQYVYETYSIYYAWPEGGICEISKQLDHLTNKL